ncbi:MAG: hypothetical protein IPG06_19370 [Haliea sp.]|nr:hypothetical protein [Haliea sp.]
MISSKPQHALGPVGTHIARPFLLLLLLLLLTLSGCRITQVVPQGGFISSASGVRDCQAGQTCVITIDGVLFSDTFTAVAAPGYRFVGWQAGQGSLCAGTDLPCALLNLPVSLSALDADTYLLPAFDSSAHPSRSTPPAPAAFIHVSSRRYRSNRKYWGPTMLCSP